MFVFANKSTYGFVLSPFGNSIKILSVQYLIVTLYETAFDQTKPAKILQDSQEEGSKYNFNTILIDQIYTDRIGQNTKQIGGLFYAINPKIETNRSTDAG